MTAAPETAAGPSVEAIAVPVAEPTPDEAATSVAGQGKRRLHRETEEERTSSDSPPRAPRKRSRAADERRTVILESEPVGDEEEEMPEVEETLAPLPDSSAGTVTKVAVVHARPSLSPLSSGNGDVVVTTPEPPIVASGSKPAVLSPAPPSDCPVSGEKRVDTVEGCKEEDGGEDARSVVADSPPASPASADRGAEVADIVELSSDDLSSDNGGDEADIGEKISGIDPYGEIRDADLDPDGRPYTDDDRVFDREEYTADSGQVWVMRGEIGEGEGGDEVFLDFVDRQWYDLHAKRDKWWSGRVEYAGTWTKCAVFRCPTPGGKSRAVQLARALEERLKGKGVVVSEAGPVPPCMRTDLHPPRAKQAAVKNGFWRKLRDEYAAFTTHAKAKEESVVASRKTARRDTGVSFLKKGTKLFG